LTPTKESFEEISRNEHDVKAKENAFTCSQRGISRYNAAQMVIDLPRSRTWIHEWLKRYKDGI
jgi:hypothetical protein